MTYRYEILMSVQMLHDYYESNISNDFEFFPTSATRAVLKRYGMVYKATSSGFYIGFRAEDQYRTPFAALDEAVSLVFGYRLKTHSLLNITQIAECSSGEVYYSDNSSMATGFELSPIPRALKPEVFSRSFQSEYPELDISLANAAGKMLDFTSVEGGEVMADETGTDIYEFVQQVNVQPYGAGNYTLQQRYNASVVDSSSYYLDTELAQARAFGIVHFDLDADTIDYTQETAYTMQWYRRSLAWQYHFVFTQDFATFSFTVEDQAPALELTDDVYPDEVTFDADDPGDYPEGGKIVFETDQDMPYYERPRKYLKLLIENDDETRVFNHLPNPSMDNPSTEIYINV